MLYKILYLFGKSQVLFYACVSLAVSRLINLQPPQKLFSEYKEGIDLYKELLETKSEELYYIKLVVLGQEMVGKTSLVRRLLHESISEVKSTSGIDINVNKYGISLRTGEWQFHKGTYLLFL